MGATPLFSRVSFKKEEQAGEVEQEEAAGGVVDGRVCQMENSEEKDGDQGDRAAGEIKALAEEPASHPSVLIDGLKGARVRRGEERSGPDDGPLSLGQSSPLLSPPQPSLHFNWSHQG